MKWADGTTYEGEWENGVQSGKGKLAMSDGTIKVGLFKDNILTEEEFSEMNPRARKLLGNSESSKQLTKLHESMLESDYDSLVKTHF